MAFSLGRHLRRSRIRLRKKPLELRRSRANAHELSIRSISRSNLIDNVRGHLERFTILQGADALGHFFVVIVRESCVVSCAVLELLLLKQG